MSSTKKRVTFPTSAPAAASSKLSPSGTLGEVHRDFLVDAHKLRAALGTLSKTAEAADPGSQSIVGKADAWLSSLEERATQIPELVSALNLSSDPSKISTKKPDPLVAAHTANDLKVDLKVSKNPLAAALAVGWPRQTLVPIEVGEVGSMEMIGKVRIRVRGSDGRPIPSAEWRVIGHLDGLPGIATLRAGRVNRWGYGALSLGNIQRSDVTGLAIEVYGAVVGHSLPINQRFEIETAHYLYNRDAGVPHELTLRDDLVVPAEGPSGPGTTPTEGAPPDPEGPGPGEGGGPGEGEGPGPDVPEDTGPEDTGPEDTGPEDTGLEDTGPEDTGPDDTGTGNDTGDDTNTGIDVNTDPGTGLSTDSDVLADVAPGGSCSLEDADAGAIEEPDPFDVQNNPEAFRSVVANADGSCSIRPSGLVAARQFFFRQVVRTQSPPLVNAGRAVERGDVRAPVPFGDESAAAYSVLAGAPVLGHLNTYRHAWYSIGQGLGDLLYSLPLAPCEEVKVAIIDWSREETASRREATDFSEKLSAELHRDRHIDEVVHSAMSEDQWGSAHTSQGGSGWNFLIWGSSSGSGDASSNSHGRRNIQASTVQNVSDNVVQKASAMRSFRSTVVTTARQREHERVETRSVRNHNRNHAMTVQYFQVLAHYRVLTELVEEKPVLFVPYAIDPELFQTLPPFSKFIDAPSTSLTRWLLRHRRLLSRIVPGYESSFEALERLVLSPELYGEDTPYATGRRWRVTLASGWRPGVHIEIETTDGQSVMLYPLMAHGAVYTEEFESDSVVLGDLSMVRVSYDSVEAYQSATTATTAPAPGSLDTFSLSRIELRVRTDRSRFIERAMQFRVIGQSFATITLGPTNPGASFALTPPTIDFSHYVSPQHRDYAHLKQLLARIQADPMRFMAAIWMSEDSNRRSLRLDAYSWNGMPLLEQIDNHPLGVFGNEVAFLLLEGHRYAQAATPNYIADERLVTVPTRGVYAEVYLSCCNASEVRDTSRFVDASQACTGGAPDISGVTTGSRFREPANLIPSQMPSNIINLQSIPEAPAPTGLLGALEVLGKADIFRDMSQGGKLTEQVGALTLQALLTTADGAKFLAGLVAGSVNPNTSTSKKTTVTDADGKVTTTDEQSSTTFTLPNGGSGVPTPGATNTGGGGGTTPGPGPGPAGTGTAKDGPSSTTPGGTTPGAGTAPGGSTTSVPAPPALATLEREAIRQTSPMQLHDVLMVLRRGVDQGLLSQKDAHQAARELLGIKTQ